LEPVILLDYASQPEMPIPDDHPPGVIDTLTVQEQGELDEFDIFDAGKVRTPGDVLSVHHIEYAAAKAAAAKLILLYGAVPANVWTGTALIYATRPHITEFVVKHLDEFERAASWPHFPKMNRSVWIALAFLVEAKSAMPDEFEEFHRGVSTGVGLAEGDPRLALRNNIMQRHMQPSRGFGGSQSILGGHIKAWNKYINDEQSRVIAYRRTELPMPPIS
jgi:hypothetical protein